MSAQFIMEFWGKRIEDQKRDTSMIRIIASLVLFLAVVGAAGHLTLSWQLVALVIIGMLPFIDLTAKDLFEKIKHMRLSHGDTSIRSVTSHKLCTSGSADLNRAG